MFLHIKISFPFICSFLYQLFFLKSFFTSSFLIQNHDIRTEAEPTAFVHHAAHENRKQRIWSRRFRMEREILPAEGARERERPDGQEASEECSCLTDVYLQWYLQPASACPQTAEHPERSVDRGTRNESACGGFRFHSHAFTTDTLTHRQAVDSSPFNITCKIIVCR